MPLRDIVTKDFGWKLLSVVLAVVIWQTVHPISEEGARRANLVNGLTTKKLQAVPVLVVSAAADVREFKVRPPVVEIIVSGKPEVLKALDSKLVHVLVNLTGIEEARDLKKRVEVSTPPGITLLSVTPADVDVVVPPRKGK